MYPVSDWSSLWLPTIMGISAWPGIGTPPYVAGELFKMMAGLDMVHVPYRGGDP
jgi:tripartite-type tricarboxylate transporter receptor subunit TctC